MHKKIILMGLLICCSIFLVGCILEDNQESVVDVNANSISDKELSLISGTYVGQDKSVLILFSDGKAAYYFENYSNMDSSDDSWMCVDGTMTWYSNKIKCNISFDVNDFKFIKRNSDIYKLYYLCSTSGNWSDEYYLKVSDNAKKMTDEECVDLISSISFYNIEDEEYLAGSLIDYYNYNHQDNQVKAEDIIKKENGAGDEIHIYKNDIEIILSYGEYYDLYCFQTNDKDQAHFLSEVNEWIEAIMDYDGEIISYEEVEGDILEMVEKRGEPVPFILDGYWEYNENGKNPWTGEYLYKLGNSFM